MPNRPWCYDHIEDYDLDRSTLPKVLAARSACLDCPRLWTCRAAATQAAATRQPPRSQVLGAVAYGYDGKPRDTEGLIAYFQPRKPEQPAPRNVGTAS